MNYLAHFYLSFGDQQLLAGQYIADAVKGNKYRNYPEQIANGILLHREIDQFTDSHPVVQDLRSMFRNELKLLTSPSIDIFFDHVLAREWSIWNKTQPLHEFASSSYTTLLQFRSLMPLRMQMMLDYMSAYDWLTNYADPAGIERTFLGLAKRFSKGAGFRSAPQILRHNYTAIAEGFRVFFPQLVDVSMTKMNTFAPTN